MTAVAAGGCAPPIIVDDVLAHTPGPWVALIMQGGVYVDAKDDDGSLENEIAYCGAAGCGERKAEANARLIAAAPDLLELVQHYAAECGDCNGTGISGAALTAAGEQHIVCEACSDIRAVLAKAGA